MELNFDVLPPTLDESLYNTLYAAQEPPQAQLKTPLEETIAPPKKVEYSPTEGEFNRIQELKKQITKNVKNCKIPLEDNILSLVEALGLATKDARWSKHIKKEILYRRYEGGYGLFIDGQYYEQQKPDEPRDTAPPPEQKYTDIKAGN